MNCGSTHYRLLAHQPGGGQNKSITYAWHVGNGFVYACEYKLILCRQHCQELNFTRLPIFISATPVYLVVITTLLPQDSGEV